MACLHLKIFNEQIARVILKLRKKWYCFVSFFFIPITAWQLKLTLNSILFQIVIAVKSLGDFKLNFWPLSFYEKQEQLLVYIHTTRDNVNNRTKHFTLVIHFIQMEWKISCRLLLPMSQMSSHDWNSCQKLDSNVCLFFSWYLQWFLFFFCGLRFKHMQITYLLNWLGVCCYNVCLSS